MIGLEPISFIPKTKILTIKLHSYNKNITKKDYGGIRTHGIL